MRAGSVIVDPSTDSGTINILCPDGYNTRREFVSAESLQMANLFDKDRNFDVIIPYVSGYKWSVDYFSSIRNINDELTQLDINKPITTQTYNRVNSLTLVINSTIQQGDINTLQGTATIISGIIPNKHDVFIAELLGNVQCIFTITSENKKDYSNSTVYEIEFKALYVISENPEIYNNLIEKTQSEYVYSNEYLLETGSSIILNSELKNKIGIERNINILSKYYIDTFTNNRNKVIALPLLSGVMVDSYLNRFVNRILSSDIKKTYYYNTSIPDIDNTYTIWDYLLSTDNNDISYCEQLTPQLVNDVSGFLKYKSLYFIGVKYITEYSKLADMNNISDEYMDICKDKNKILKYPILFNRDDSNLYVFGKNMYNGISDVGILEKEILKYIRHEYLDQNVLDILFLEYRYWSTYDQFYGIPILLLLYKYCNSLIFSKL